MYVKNGHKTHVQEQMYLKIEKRKKYKLWGPVNQQAH